MTLEVLANEFRTDELPGAVKTDSDCPNPQSYASGVRDRDALEWLSGGEIGHDLSLLKPFPQS